MYVYYKIYYDQSSAAVALKYFKSNYNVQILPKKFKIYICNHLLMVHLGFQPFFINLISGDICFFTTNLRCLIIMVRARVKYYV